MSLQKIKAEYEDLLEQDESGDSHWHKLFVSNVKDKLKSVQSRIGPISNGLASTLIPHRRCPKTVTSFDGYISLRRGYKKHGGIVALRRLQNNWSIPQFKEEFTQEEHEKLNEAVQMIEEVFSKENYNKNTKQIKTELEI